MAKQTFRDHFSSSSPAYARFRPRYPHALFDWIAGEAPGTSRVWDCATGERQLIERGYVDVPIPFTPVEAPVLTMETSMTMAGLEGYIGTWSATERYREARGHDPVPGFMARVADVWGDPESAKPADWPMAIRAGRV